MGEVKGLPYGIASFEDLRAKDRYCVDKSMYIPKLEDAGDFLFLIRPRRFGKSVFLSMLRDYYDMSSQGRFDRLFDGLWIKDHPTSLKGKYQVIYFDFSQAAVGRGGLEERFHKYCSNQLLRFASRYAAYYDEDFLEEVKRKAPDSADQLRYICGQADDRDIPLYLIIDEYDNFTNNVLNERGEAVYHALTHATGFYRDVFKIYKANFQRILMMGVSPVTLDDLTSGFNIARNITADPRFNTMLGFSEREVREMIQYYKDAGLIKAEVDELVEDMRPWYDNYCFAKGSLGKDPLMFNCDMVVYYLRHYLDFGCPPEQMLDVNTRTDYTKLKKLIQLDGMGEEQRGIIQRVATEGKILGNINPSFPAERIFEKENFISLLYYYGMLTITGTYGSLLELGIPNNNVRKQYYEYLLTEYGRMGQIDFSELQLAYYDMAMRGRWRPSLERIAGDYARLSSVRDAMEGERNLQGFVVSALSVCAYYLTAPEVELAHGYCDIYLLPDRQRYPQTAHSYIIELKYLTAKDSEEAAKRQWQEAEEQVRRYAKDRKVTALSQGSELHLIVMQVRTYELVRLEEVC